MKYGSQWWNGYGHVWIVLDIDRSSRQILIEDMNYVWRYVVSQHWVDMDSSKNPVIGYIYP
jgi:surface antigen